MSGRQPNVLVVFTDQQRWDSVGCYGNPIGLTPNLDAMANRGVQFERAFTCQPVCAPARASLQTGLYATATGVWRNDLALPAHHVTLADHFNAAGYETGYVGKWHLAGVNPVPKELRGGYRHWRGSDLLEATSHPYGGVVYDNDNQPVELQGYRVDALTDIALNFIRQDRSQPFYLFLSFLEPHYQNDMQRYVAPDGYAKKYADCHVPADMEGLDGDCEKELADYYGMVARIDENFGRLQRELESLEIADDTIVLFTSDHGCHFRTRNEEYKRSCHESSIRIPMVLDGPLFRRGGRISQLVSLVDLPPTLLAASGLDLPDRMQGRNMLPLVGGATEEWQNEVFVQISESHTGRAIRTERWKYCVIAPGGTGGTDPDDSCSDCYEDHHLYDLQADPHERTNLVGYGEYREITEYLRQRLKERIVAAGEDEPIIRAMSARPAEQKP